MTAKHLKGYLIKTTVFQLMVEQKSKSAKIDHKFLDETALPTIPTYNRILLTQRMFCLAENMNTTP